MTLSRREGVDIRPTLLRVLTDLYVQARAHSSDEERQFVELTSRLIDQVDDATRAAVRARLAIYPGTPVEIMAKLGLKPADPDPPIPLAAEIPVRPVATPLVRPLTDAQLRMHRACRCSQPTRRDQRDVFPRELQRARIDPAQSRRNPAEGGRANSSFFAERAVETLEMAAFAADVENFTLELGETLILPAGRSPGGQ